MSKYPITSACNGCATKLGEKYELVALEPSFPGTCPWCYEFFSHIRQYENLGRKGTYGRAARPAPQQEPRKKDTRAYSRENWRSWLESET